MDAAAVSNLDLYRPSAVYIDLEALSYNYNLLKEHVRPAKVMAIVKANAYGHGLLPVVKHLVAAGVDAFGVALLEEGLALRDSGVNASILVCGGILRAEIPILIERDLEITVSSLEQLEEVESIAAKLKKKARVHLKLDTGMGRLGIDYRKASLLFEKSLSGNNCIVVGICSHFATADAIDLEFAKLQFGRFKESTEFFSQRHEKMPLRHMANSGAAIRLRESHMDMVRLGLSLYGAHGGEHLRNILKLRPVMSVRSRVVLCKVIKKGESVGYGCTWRAEQDTRIAIVPIGYGDGYLRSLSNRGQVVIGEKRCAVVGTVCMDQIMVDVESLNVNVGDEVVIIGKQGDEVILLEEVATWAQTIPYEIMTAFDLRMPRHFVNLKT